MSGFSCKLGSMMAAFLDYRSALGYSRRHFHDALRSLDKFILAEYPDEESLTGDIVTDWVTAQVGNQDQKTSCVRLFAEYLNSIGQTAYVFPRGHKRPRRATSSGKSETAYIFTDDELRRLFVAILNQPDAATEKGLRDQFLLVLMYDTAARLQEIRGLSLRSITWGREVSVTLHGKGNKTRVVPLMKSTVDHLKNYLKVFHPDYNREENAYADAFLFYVMQHGRCNPISDSAARKLVRDYGEKAKDVCMEISGIIHPHLLRHSRAMHLYQHGMDLALVQQWLGHAQIETTQVYAYADTEHKRKAIEKATAVNNPLRSKNSAKRFTITDEETLKKLYGLA